MVVLVMEVAIKKTRPPANLLNDDVVVGLAVLEPMGLIIRSNLPDNLCCAQQTGMHRLWKHCLVDHPTEELSDVHVHEINLPRLSWHVTRALLS